jgi:hypothetical protein
VKVETRTIERDSQFTRAVDAIANAASLDTSQGRGDFRPEPARKVRNSISWEPVKRHRFAPGSEREAFIANLCEVYEVKCATHGGRELCPVNRTYDPLIMEGGMPGATVWCICDCHRKRKRPPSNCSLP